MKIFIAFLQSPYTHPIPAYDFWPYYIKNGIEEAGDEWVECSEVDWAAGIVPKTEEAQTAWLEFTWQKVTTFIDRNKPDLFLSYLYPEQIEQQAIKHIRAFGVPCVNFFCDHVRLFNKLPDAFKVFDLSWVPEVKALPLYKKANVNCLNLPMPMWVAPQYRVSQEESYPQVTFVGSSDIQRAMLFEQILSIQPELPLAIYGEGWNNDDSITFHNPSYSIIKKIKHQFDFLFNRGLTAYFRKLQKQGSSVTKSKILAQKVNASTNFDDYIALTASSAVTIGINRYPDFRYPLRKPNSYSRLRDIEAPTLGACYLTEWTAGIDLLYDIEQEILTYKTAEEFIVQCNRLLNDKVLRTKLRKNGQSRALATHSIPASLGIIKQCLFR